MPELRLPTPSLLEPGESALQLDVPPPEALRMTQLQLDPSALRPALLRIDPGTLTMPPGLTDLEAAEGEQESGPLVPPGAGPESPREASGGDVMRAVMAVPAVDTALSNLQGWAVDRLERDWRRLSTGEQALTITATAVIGGAALTGVLAHPDSRRWALDALAGRTFPVPGVDGLSFEVSPRGSEWTVGLHLDVGALLPAELGFGPSSPSAFGAPPAPASAPGEEVQ